MFNKVLFHMNNLCFFYRKGNSNSAEAGKCTQKDTTSPDENPKFSAKDILKNLRQHLHTKGLDENSAVLLNYGLEFVKRMSFKNFRRFMDSVAKSLKEYKGQPVWRTIPSKWKPNADASKKFENYQVKRHSIALVHIRINLKEIK